MQISKEKSQTPKGMEELKKINQYYVTTVRNNWCDSLSLYCMMSPSEQTGILMIVTFRKRHTKKESEGHTVYGKYLVFRLLVSY